MNPNFVPRYTIPVQTRLPNLLVSAQEHDRDGQGAVLSLAGRVSIADNGWLRPLMDLQAAQSQSRLVVDLSRLSSMDWWVALMLAWVGRVVSRRGGVLILASPQPAVARLLDAVGACGPVAVSDGVHGNAAGRPASDSVHGNAAGRPTPASGR